MRIALGRNFSGEDLSGHTFKHENLRNADFTDCDLSGAVFEDCDVTGADFRGAYTRGIEFIGGCYGDAIEDYSPCEDCDYLTRSDNLYHVHSGRNEKMVCEDCRDNYYWCSGCDELFDSVEDDYCRGCWDQYMFACQGCGYHFGNDDACYTEYDNSPYCCDCFPSTESDEEYSPCSFVNLSGYEEIGSSRRYGIELETSDCSNYTDYAGPWGAKHDGSITGMEFYSAILEGDDGLAAIEDLCGFADSNDWSVDSSCGYHLHLDMTGESDDKLFAIAYAYRSYQGLFNKYVSESRWHNSYCSNAHINCAEITLAKDSGDFNSFCNRDGRNWINFRAYYSHTTFEVRLHEGTLNAQKIINWVKMHTHFADWASKTGFEGVREKLDNLTDDGKRDFLENVICADCPKKAFA